MLGRLLLLSSSSSSSILRLHRRAGHIQSRQCHRQRQAGHMSIVHARSVLCIFTKHGCRCEHFGGELFEELAVSGCGETCVQSVGLPQLTQARHFRKNSTAGLEAGACHRTTFEVGTTPGMAHSNKTLIMSQLQSQNDNRNNSDNS